MVDMLAAVGFVRRHNTWNLLEQASVFPSMRTARALPLREMPKLDSQNGGLDFIQAAVPTRLAAQVLSRLAVIAQGAEARGKLRRIRNDHSSVAVSSKIFCRVEAQACRIAKGADAASFVHRADGLRAVFNQRELARLREGHDRDRKSVVVGKECRSRWMAEALKHR